MKEIHISQFMITGTDLQVNGCILQPLFSIPVTHPEDTQNPFQLTQALNLVRSFMIQATVAIIWYEL